MALNTARAVGTLVKLTVGTTRSRDCFGYSHSLQHVHMSLILRWEEVFEKNDLYSVVRFSLRKGIFSPCCESQLFSEIYELSE